MGPEWGEHMGMVNERCRRRLLALVVVVAVGAAGCSSDSDADSTSPTDRPVDAGVVNRDGRVSIGFDLTANGTFGWEPGTNPSATSLDPLYYLVYGRLMRQGSDGSVIPDQAQSVTVVDSNTIDIVLRPGQTWQDGAPFDAASVKAGLDHNLATDPNVSGFSQPFYAPMGGVEVVDATTVRVKFTTGTAASWYDSFMTTPAVTITRPGDYRGTPIGAGPMRITEYRPDTKLTMDRYEGFWNVDEVGFAGIDFVQISIGSPQSSTAALQSDQADIVTFDTSQIAALSGSLEPAIVKDPTRLMRFGMCKRDAPFDNVDIRRAISKAIDREALNEVVFAGTGEPAVQLWPEGNRFFNPEVGDELDYDPEGAKQLVADSGISDPTFDLYIIDFLGISDAAEVIAAQLADVGITARINPVLDLPAEFLAPQTAGATIFPATQNVGLLKFRDINGTSMSNLCSFRNAEFDALYATLSTVASDSEDAEEAWWDLAEVYADVVPSVPLVFGSIVGGYNSDSLFLGDTYVGGLYVFPDVYSSHMID